MMAGCLKTAIFVQIIHSQHTDGFIFFLYQSDRFSLYRMSFFLEHTERIIRQYEGNTPLSVFLKAYFRQYPRLGSRDRKALSEAVHIYYRCRRFFREDCTIAGVIAKGIVLCGSSNAFLLRMIPAEDIVPAEVIEGLPDFDHDLSPALPPAEWLRSLWQQPQLFIRVRRRLQQITGLLETQGIPFVMEPQPGNAAGDCLKLPNGSAIDQLLPETDYVVQDWASQASIHLLLQQLPAAPVSVWDVCSGAGGKSLLLKDRLGELSLLASDVRESILHNLQQRFKRYQLGKASTLVLNSADAAAVAAKLDGRLFDLVLCDVPCSGSGTWARTPEQFHFYRPEGIQKFIALQYPIAFNAARHVAPGGTLAYITCSVFRQENEAVVERLQQTTTLTLVDSRLINGIERQADCLFLAVFRNRS